MSNFKELEARLKRIENRAVRIESRVVRGFEELGVSLDVDPDWMRVDDETNTVYVKTLGRSLAVINQEMKSRGATKLGDTYVIVHDGVEVGSLMFEPRF